MGKKSATRAMPSVEFRESDFAGMKPTDQAELSGSLNRLSERLASTRQLLREMERPQSPSVLSGLRPDATPPANDTPTQRRT